MDVLLNGVPTQIPDWPNWPVGASLYRAGNYLRITGAALHPLANLKGEMPYHRFILFESLGRPLSCACLHCGYVLPWKSSLQFSQQLVINADHLDGDTSNNDPKNLAPSCGWCNANRAWAERFPEFWSQWRRWMADVPPSMRPNLPAIAVECGIDHGLVLGPAGPKPRNLGCSPGTGAPRKSWSERFAEMKAFIAEHGNDRVGWNDPKHPGLASWACNQRAKRAVLAADRIAALNEIGFDWRT